MGVCINELVAVMGSLGLGLKAASSQYFGALVSLEG